MGCLFSAWKTINGATGRFSLLQFPYIGGPHRPARPFLGAGLAYFKPLQTPGRPPFPDWHFLENSLPGALSEGWPGPLFRAVSAFRPRAGPGILPVAPGRPRPPYKAASPGLAPVFWNPGPAGPRKRALSQTTPFMTKSGNTRNAFWTMRRRFPRTSLDTLR